jgi:ABC-type lipoprotein export system ATPase subunit
MSESPALVDCTNVNRMFESVAAVRDVSCTIRGGDRVVIVGASGSGKSTLLHLLGGVDIPTSGTVSWPALGDREQLRPREIALIFQTPSLLPPLDVIENVALPLLLGGAPERAAMSAARAALARLGLEEFALKLPQELSGGQAQRVAVARVIAGTPRLVLADEPTGQLDHATGEHMLDILDAAASSLGAALVLSTHDHRVARRFTSRWAMTDGRLQREAA